MTSPLPSPALPTPPSLVLLDLDGTLTDSAPGIMGSMRHALAEAGFPVPDDERLRAIVGPPLHESLLLLGVPQDRVDELIGLYRAAFVAGGMFDNAVFPGIPEALGALQDAGVRMVVATSKPEVYARQIVEHFGLAPYLDGGVDGVFGADADGGPRSAKAQVVAHALASVAARRAAAGEPMPAADATVMVGDREHDVLGAREHGLRTVSVGWGYAVPGEIEEAGPAATVATPAELVHLLVA
ncbi:HAD hydrolase-like protein [Luteimicrobium subarcticum]|uniref:Phosphoglycolate phosphatase n=1 Tax=Luteimicrobium subarcticum TaxID=620910 RepID=A0A2M8WRZ9_9MICO|nr:HAD hydrolase-like protein [Luteimicrobium subarcticum]PJI93713.1 phosphoglycolate phosphatase [Luteimicrobium subarcticum]